jgi:hypothetical protein
VRGSCSDEQGGAAVSLGVVGPMIHRLWTWTTLITAPEAVVCRLLGSVSPGTQIDRCGRSYRRGRPYPIIVRFTDDVEERPGSLLDCGCGG